MKSAKLTTAYMATVPLSLKGTFTITRDDQTAFPFIFEGLSRGTWGRKLDPIHT
jgi:hypothetical protein